MPNVTPNPIKGLTFEPGSHIYRMDGIIIPSVTQILAPLSDFSGVPADVLQAASEFGTAVHRACELHDRRVLEEKTLDPALFPYLNAWKEFCFDFDAQWAMIESAVYHPTLRYCGQLDRFGKLGKDKYVVDIKTTAELYPTVGPQLAAYRMALPEDMRERCMRMAVQLKADGTYATRTYVDQNDWPVFASLITLRNWCTKHGITPNYTPNFR